MQNCLQIHITLHQCSSNLNRKYHHLSISHQTTTPKTHQLTHSRAHTHTHTYTNTCKSGNQKQTRMSVLKRINSDITKIRPTTTTTKNIIVIDLQCRLPINIEHQLMGKLQFFIESKFVLDMSRTKM